MTIVETLTPERGLARRLHTVASTLDVSVPRGMDEPDDLPGPGDLLAHLIEHLRVSWDSAEAWLVLVAVCGAMPMPGLVRALQRKLQVMQPFEVAGDLLDMAFDDVIANGNPLATLEVVSDRVVVDVDHTVTHPKFITGIQRVVRKAASTWVTDHDAALVAWRGGAFRRLDADEQALIDDDDASSSDGSDERLVVPWRVPLALFEVPAVDHSRRLEAAAEAGAISLRLVGYDCIPVASGELVPAADRLKFGMYLEMLKWSERVAAISETAASEFQSFGRALEAQGLRGPQIHACPLPTETPVSTTSSDVSTGETPLVLCVGSLGRRKNQLTLVEVSELLWREGHRFDLAMIGSGDTPPKVLVDLIAELKKAGRPITVKRGVSDEELATAYASARCVVFLSVHEGFGLPVAEALSHRIPVIAPSFGSVRELAAGHGGLLVEPEDVSQVVDAIRRLLTDDALHARLVQEASARPSRTWQQYANELWDVLIA
jgi:hypothetical protein